MDTDFTGYRWLLILLATDNYLFKATVFRSTELLEVLQLVYFHLHPGVAGSGKGVFNISREKGVFNIGFKWSSLFPHKRYCLSFDLH